MRAQDFITAAERAQVCACVCFCTCYRDTKQNTLSIGKVGHFLGGEEILAGQHNFKVLFEGLDFLYIKGLRVCRVVLVLN